MLIGLLVRAAFAASSLALEVSPDAEVVVLPRVADDRTEIAIYDNLHAIRPQLTGKSLDGVRKLEALSVGGGTTFVTAWLTKPGLVAEITRDGRAAKLTIKPGKAPPIVPEGAPNLEALLEPGRPRQKAPLPPSLLRPLDLDGREPSQPPAGWVQTHATFPAPEGPCADLLVAPDDGVARLADVDRYRQALVTCGRTDKKTRQDANRRLAFTYLDLGLPREAVAYLDRLGAEAGPDAALARARAALAVGRPEVARVACGDAHRAHAAEIDVLRCLGAVTLVSADPPPTEVARRLVLAADAPADRRLAAELLLRDRRATEALPLLAGVDDPDGQLAHGDALYAVGRTTDARRVWLKVEGPLRPLADLRTLMSTMVEAGPRKWAAKVPLLEQIARTPGRVGVEARFLLVQVATAYGDPETAGVHLGKLVDADRAVAWRSEVPERLEAACTARIDQLYRAERYADALSSFERCWREGLDQVVVDEAPLEHVVDAYRRLGLFAAALDVQRRVINIETADGRDELASVQSMAALFVDTGRIVEALETVAWIRGRRPTGPNGELDLIEARAQALRGDTAAARLALLRAIGDPATAPGATLDLARLDARTGNCAAAIPVLEANTSDDGLAFALVRCLLDVQRPADALPLAKSLVARAKTPGDATEARVMVRAAWLAAGRPSGEDLEDALGKQLVADEASHKALLARTLDSTKPMSAQEAVDKRRLEEKAAATKK